MKPNLAGKHVLVTGAGGCLGRSLTAACTEAGATVSAFTRTRPSGPEVRHSASPDLTDPTSVSRALAELEAHCGPADALIHAAATNTDRLMARQTPDSWSETWDSSVKAAFLCSQAVLPGFFRQGSGTILYIGSLAAVRPQPGQCAYAASKGALESFTRAQARELAPKQIRINCLAPGFIDSPRVRDLPQDRQDHIQSLIPLGRWAKPEEVAAWAVFLLSPVSAYLTGQTIHLDGGASI